MKAIVYKQYGGPDVLKIQEVERPVPKGNEMLVRVHTTSVNYGDLLARKFRYVTTKEFNMPGIFWLMAKLAFGLKKPKTTILGSEFSGTVESVGCNVQTFKAGDAVFGYVGQRMGAYAEYISIPEKGVIDTKPGNISFEEAAVIPYGSIMALYLLRKMNIQAGQKVLINGASGGIGSAAVQIANHYGASVTGICSTPRLAFVKSLGADRVIDYTKENFTDNGEKYDLIFDVLGKCSYSKCKNSLSRNGHILYASFKLGKLVQSVWNGKVVCGIAPESAADLHVVKELIESGKIQAGIDKVFPMEQAANAHRYAEGGKAQGKIAINIREND